MSDGIGSVVFAHKTTEGWEALLNGIWRSGWAIKASWPVATEMGERLNARETASLATSVHLVCRPRVDNAIGDWGNVLRELPRRVADWMERLQAEGIRGADLVFACIGPALEIFSRYSKVVDPQEREIPLGGDPEATEPHKRGYLTYVWEVVGRTALQQVLGVTESQARNGLAGALEEDARLTALFLWTMQSTDLTASNGKESTEPELEGELTPKAKGKGFSLPFDVVRRFAQPLGIHLPDWEARIIQTEKGVVRVIPVLDRGKQLFGEEGATAVADELEQSGGRSGPAQLSLFPEEIPQPKLRRGRRKKGMVDVSDEQLQSHRDATTLDRVHAAMLLQASVAYCVAYWKSMHARAVERNTKLQAELDQAKAEIRQLKAERFGRQSEKQSAADRSNDLDDPQNPATSKKKRGQQPGRPAPKRRDYSHLTAREELIDLAGDAKICDYCGKPLADLGLAVMMFSIFATLALWKINPRKWLSWYLEACAASGGKPPDNATSFLPWNLSETRLADLRSLSSSPCADDCADDTS